MAQHLIGVDLATELVRTVVYSGRVKNTDHPLSLLLIGPPESGKTSVVTDSFCKSIAAFTDVTGMGLMKIAKLEQITHIVLLDMIAVMSHRENVNKYCSSLLNALTEEGLEATASPEGITVMRDAKNSRRKMGVIGCLTPDLVKSRRQWWHKIGFLTRMVPFNYELSNGLVSTIKDGIISTNYIVARAERELVVPQAHVRVEMCDNMAREVAHCAEIASAHLHETGIRRLKQFKMLAWSHALLRHGWKKPEVTPDDVRFLRDILPYVSYTRSTPL